jgi:hypothetical protein
MTPEHILPTLIPYRFDDRWGYVDNKYNIAIPFNYDDARPFYEGAAAVKKNSLWGFIDEEGNNITQIKYNNVSNFKNGYASVQKAFRIPPRTYKHDGKEKPLLGIRNFETDKDNWWGCIDIKGNVVVEPTYWYWGLFADGLFLFADNIHSFGFRDESSNLIIDTTYWDARPFSEGIACVKVRTRNSSNDNCFFINNLNQRIFENGFSFLSDFKNGYATVSVSEGVEWPKSCGVINKEGKFIIEPQYEGIGKYYSQGLIAVKNKIYDENGCYDDKYGFIDINNNMVIPSKFVLAKSFNNDRAAVYTSLGEFTSSCGYIDLEGNMVIDDIYESGNDFENNIALVKYDGTYGYIDINGNQYWSEGILDI